MVETGFNKTAETFCVYIQINKNIHEHKQGIYLYYTIYLYTVEYGSPFYHTRNKSCFGKSLKMSHNYDFFFIDTVTLSYIIKTWNYDIKCKMYEIGMT